MLITPGCLVRLFIGRSIVVASNIYLVPGQNVRFFQRVSRKKLNFLDSVCDLLIFFKGIVHTSLLFVSLIS